VFIFDAKTHIPQLAYNFTGFQHIDGKGNCHGSGVIPEPTYERLVGWYSTVNHLRRPPLPSAGGTAPEERVASIRAEVLRAISELGGGRPAVWELEELPHRVLVAFFRWLTEALSPLEAVGF
jgi:hypothetical protein